MFFVISIAVGISKQPCFYFVRIKFDQKPLPNFEISTFILVYSLLCLYMFYILLQEFLKKEFSQENILFWRTCEQYKPIEDSDKVF